MSAQAPEATSSAPQTPVAPVSLAPWERGRVVLLFLLIVGATVVSFSSLFFLSQSIGALASLGIVAYVLGLRHGADADHIAAIDNTTRKLLQDGKRPLTVGTWFSLGHSTVVVLLISLLVVVTDAVKQAIPALRSVGFVVGTTVSGVFLLLIGLLNVVIVVEVYRIFRDLRMGKVTGEEMERRLTTGGVLYRLFGRVFRVVEEPWHLYFIGFLFGLGFDTATEVMLIGLSIVTVETLSVPLWMILVLPILFTCGMVLVDTVDAVAMRMAYGWAFSRPLRKIYYNLTITVISVLVAFVIGAVELLQVLSTELGLAGGPWSFVQGLGLGSLGFVVVGLFVGTWLVAMAYYRHRRFEDLVLPGTPPRPAH